MMNILEQEDIIKGLPDQALMQEAQMPSGQVPQFLVVSEIQRRSDMRKRYKAEQEQMPQATVKEQVVQEGIMGAMPPQMAMAPQMPQRMPQMPPQGIQQAMPPQRMSGGGIVRMANGGVLEEVLATGTDLTQQRLRGLLVAGVPDAELMQLGYNEEDIARGRLGLKETYNMTVSDDYVGGMREIESPARRDPSLVAPSGQRYSPPLAEIASATADSALGAMADGYNNMIKLYLKTLLAVSAQSGGMILMRPKGLKTYTGMKELDLQ